MLDVLDTMLFYVKFKVMNFVEEIKEDETGVSAFVATVLLILLAVLLAAMFWDKIREWFNSTWDTITNDTKSIGGGAAGGE